VKIQALSDLHLKCRRQCWKIPGTIADVVVLAGDISINGAGVEWAREEAQRLGKPIIYEPGNHEYYESEFHSDSAREPAIRTLHTRGRPDTAPTIAPVAGSVIGNQYRKNGGGYPSRPFSSRSVTAGTGITDQWGILE